MTSSSLNIDCCLLNAYFSHFDHYTTIEAKSKAFFLKFTAHLMVYYGLNGADPQGK
jgi:hypothetical protein